MFVCEILGFASLAFISPCGTFAKVTGWVDHLNKQSKTNMLVFEAALMYVQTIVSEALSKDVDSTFFSEWPLL